MGDTGERNRGIGKMTVNNALEEYPTYAQQRQLVWPIPALFIDKFCEKVRNLKLPAAFFVYIHNYVWRSIKLLQNYRIRALRGDSWCDQDNIDI